MRDESLHIKKDGRVFKMLDGFTLKPMAFKKAKHNYTKKDLDGLKVNRAIVFSPMYGNANPVYSALLRIK